ncbi:MAG: hypothetical protein KAH01_05780, partial [Caldisericia bacterium]|nr:hypothetical protein [Caldisericia bacterium]
QITDDYYVPTTHFFAFNRARLKDDKKLQQRGVDAIENISSAAKNIPGFDCKTLIEPVRTIEEYRENPEDPKVTQKTVFDSLEEYAKSVTAKETFIIYSHSHGLKNYFNPEEPWGGLYLDKPGSDLPHKGITTWPQYAEKLLAIPAKTVVVLTMSCYSGGFVDYLKTIEDQWVDRESKKRNFLLITSQNSTEMSKAVRIEGKICNPFTYAVQKAFEGEADGYLSNKPDGKTTIEEFKQYILDTTHKYNPKAYPQFIGLYLPSTVLLTHPYQIPKLNQS